MDGGLCQTPDRNDPLHDQAAAIQQAITTNDGKTLARITHTLKSSSAMLGAISFSALCKELETMGEKNQLAQAAQKIPRFMAEAKEVKEALLATSPQLVASKAA